MRGRYYNTRLGELTPFRLFMFLLGKLSLVVQLFVIPRYLGCTWSHIAAVVVCTELAGGYWYVRTALPLRTTRQRLQRRSSELTVPSCGDCFM